MKLVMMIVVFAVGVMMTEACHTSKPSVATPPATPKTTPFVTWDKQLIELGDVKKGEKRTMFFEMTNVSQEDAKIDIIDHCTCTTSDYPRGVIKPGGKARIDLVFDSTEKDSSELIEARVIFTNSLKSGVPRIELLKYHFNLIK
jgi:hypothetical protein